MTGCYFTLADLFHCLADGELDAWAKWQGKRRGSDGVPQFRRSADGVKWHTDPGSREMHFCYVPRKAFRAKLVARSTDSHLGIRNVDEVNAELVRLEFEWLREPV